MSQRSTAERDQRAPTAPWTKDRLAPPPGAPEDLVDMVRDFEPAPVTTTCVLDSWRAQALAGVLGAQPPATRDGDELPLGWHEVYFRDPLATGGVAEDGHALGHALMPPRRPRRRVFGGASMTSHHPLRLGEEVTRTASVVDCRIRSGRTGWLLLLTELHEITAGGQVALTERRNVVLRHDGPPAGRPTSPAAGPAPTSAQQDRSGSRDDPGPDEDGETPTDVSPTALMVLRPDRVTLFRFSALTYNPHRIHYDAPYATEVEGHEDLVVHGPLTALNLLEVARRSTPEGTRLTEYAFTLQAPAYVDRELRFEGALRDGTWTLTGHQQGRRVVQATAR